MATSSRRYHLSPYAGRTTPNQTLTQNLVYNSTWAALCSPLHAMPWAQIMHTHFRVRAYTSNVSVSDRSYSTISYLCPTLHLLVCRKLIGLSVDSRHNYRVGGPLYLVSWAHIAHIHPKTIHIDESTPAFLLFNSLPSPCSCGESRN